MIPVSNKYFQRVMLYVLLPNEINVQILLYFLRYVLLEMCPRVDIKRHKLFSEKICDSFFKILQDDVENFFFNGSKSGGNICYQAAGTLSTIKLDAFSSSLNRLRRLRKKDSDSKERERERKRETDR